MLQRSLSVVLWALYPAGQGRGITLLHREREEREKRSQAYLGIPHCCRSIGCFCRYKCCSPERGRCQEGTASQRARKDSRSSAHIGLHPRALPLFQGHQRSQYHHDPCLSLPRRAPWATRGLALLLENSKAMHCDVYS